MAGVRLAALVALAAVAAGCGEGTSTLAVTVHSTRTVAAVDHLRVVVTDAGGRKSHEVDVPVGHDVGSDALPFSLKLPAALRGQIGVTVDAVNAAGAQLASGSGSVGVKPSTSAKLDVTLIPPPQWVPSSDGLLGGAVTSLAFDPKDRTRAWLTTRSAGVFRSLDGGVSWAPSSNGLPTRATNSIAVDPFDSARILVATDNGAFVSTDSGKSWTVVIGSIPMAKVEQVAFDPKVQGNVWASTYGAVYASAYFMGNTALIFHQAGGDLGAAGTPALVVDAASNVYAAQNNNGTGGAWKLPPNSATWAKLTFGMVTPQFFNCAAVSPTAVFLGDDDTGLWKGATGATAFTAVTSLALTEVDAVAVAPSNPMVMYASGFDKDGKPHMYRSGDGGTSFAAAGNGLDGGFVFAYAVDPTDPNVVIASGRGVIRTINGTDWVPQNIGLTGYPVLSMLVDPTLPKVVLAGTADGGLWRSIDGGAHWLSVEGSDTIAVYALVAAGDLLIEGGLQGIRVSLDHGGTWTQADGSAYTLSLAVAPSNPLRIYGGGNGGAVSVDGGMHWTKLAGIPTSYSVMALAVDPTNDMLVYAATDDGGVQRSLDGGTTFVPVNGGLTQLNTQALAILPDQPSTLLVGTTNGVFRTTDGGANWTPASGTVGLNAAALAVNPKQPAQLFLAAPNAGVFTSDDGGASWRPDSAGLVDTHVVSISIDATSGDTLFTGTAGSGIFKRAP